MKVLGVFVLIYFIALAKSSFVPNCSKKELDILWPNYDDRKTYYNCSAIGQPEHQPCPDQTFFSFVYQTCTSEELYKSPPDEKYLPTEFPPFATTTTTRKTSTLPTPATGAPESTPAENTTNPSTLPEGSTSSEIDTDVITKTTEDLVSTTDEPLVPGPPSSGPTLLVPTPSTPLPTPVTEGTPPSVDGRKFIFRFRRY